MKIVTPLLFFCLLMHSPGVYAGKIMLYGLEAYETSPGKTIPFVSVSDIYVLSDNPDSAAVPDVTDLSADSAKCLKLEGEYRKRFFERTGIAEADKVFIYDYAENMLVSVPVKNLNVVACLDIYSDEQSRPYTQSSYMIGFEIDKKYLKQFKSDYALNTLVSVGEEHPFAIKKLTPITWEKAEPRGNVAETINIVDTAQMNHWFAEYITGNAYTYKGEDFQYFVREFIFGKRVVARHLLVINLKTSKTVYNHVYYESESMVAAPLNFVDAVSAHPNQWTGVLFKNKPEVIFGFNYVGFGCPAIEFLSLDEKAIGINCDNRH